MSDNTNTEVPLLEVVVQHQAMEKLNQPKENCILKRCTCIMTVVNVGGMILLILGVILGILKINGKI